MKLITLILSAMLSLPCLAQDDSNEMDGVISLLVAAKATGACGVIHQLVSFQESTKMQGGDEFIVRFLNTEMARLNKTLPDFLKECNVAIQMYNTTLEELGYEQVVQSY